MPWPETSKRFIPPRCALALCARSLRSALRKRRGKASARSGGRASSLQPFRNPVRHAHRVGDDGERRVHGADRGKKARIGHVEIIEFVRLAIDVEHRGRGVGAEGSEATGGCASRSRCRSRPRCPTRASGAPTPPPTRRWSRRAGTGTTGGSRASSPTPPTARSGARRQPCRGSTRPRRRARTSTARRPASARWRCGCGARCSSRSRGAGDRGPAALRRLR